MVTHEYGRVKATEVRGCQLSVNLRTLLDCVCITAHSTTSDSGGSPSPSGVQNLRTSTHLPRNNTRSQ